MSCSYCSTSDKDHLLGKKCCWAQAMEIIKFKKHVWRKFIVEVFFDMIISMTSVLTDIIAIILYLSKKKYSFALLTAIPVLLPTFVFTNVYLRDESEKKFRSNQISKLPSASGSISKGKTLKEKTSTSDENFDNLPDWEGPEGSMEGSSNTDENIQELSGGEDKETQCEKLCNYHCSFCGVIGKAWVNFMSGCFQCFCNRDSKLRRKGADAARNSAEKMFKYGFGTFILRFIAWAWYIKALIYGLKAFKEPKKFLKIKTPENHWSYELLVRLDFLQAALENAPQCCIQLYALMTQPDEDVALGLLTLCFSFVDFIRISVSVHWDMNKGPVTAPLGCYRTAIWKLVNTLSWIFVYASRSAGLAYIFAISNWKDWIWLPVIILTVHCGVLGKLLSKAEYGVAAQKIIVATFISLFFLPELDTSVMPAIIQLYYAMIIVQNTLFILPWRGFENQLCITQKGMGSDPGRGGGRAPPNSNTGAPGITNPSTGLPGEGGYRTTPFMIKQIIQTTTEEPIDGGCLLDPLFITLSVPFITIVGAVFRLIASQRMAHFKKNLSLKNVEEMDQTQTKFENSLVNLFSKRWSRMSVKEMFSAFVRMLKKEVIISTDEFTPGPSMLPGGKKMSFLATAPISLQADFLASQTFIRESFSFIARTTRSHDLNGVFKEEEEAKAEYNSDSELTFRNLKKRPRLPRSRNISESKEPNGPISLQSQAEYVQVELPTGSHLLEMCWI